MEGASDTISTDDGEKHHAAPEPQDEGDGEDEAHWGEVADPVDAEEAEPEAIGEAIRALRLPSHTPEQLAQLERLAENAERNER